MSTYAESIAIRAMLEQLAREAAMAKMSSQKRREHNALCHFAIFDK